MIIEWTLNGKYHNRRDVILTSRMAVCNNFITVTVIQNINSMILIRCYDLVSLNIIKLLFLGFFSNILNLFNVWMMLNKCIIQWFSIYFTTRSLFIPLLVRIWKKSFYWKFTWLLCSDTFLLFLLKVNIKRL